MSGRKNKERARVAELEGQMRRAMDSAAYRQRELQKEVYELRNHSNRLLQIEVRRSQDLARRLEDIREQLEPLAVSTTRVCPNCNIFVEGTQVRMAGSRGHEPMFECRACDGRYSGLEWAKAYQMKVAVTAAKLVRPVPFPVPDRAGRPDPFDPAAGEIPPVPPTEPQPW